MSRPSPGHVLSPLLTGEEDGGADLTRTFRFCSFLRICALIKHRDMPSATRQRSLLAVLQHVCFGAWLLFACCSSSPPATVLRLRCSFRTKSLNCVPAVNKGEKRKMAAGSLSLPVFNGWKGVATIFLGHMLEQAPAPHEDTNKTHLQSSFSFSSTAFYDKLLASMFISKHAGGKRA